MSDEEIRNRVDRGKVVEIAGGRLNAVSVEAFLEMEIPARESLLSPWLPSQGLVMVFAERGIGKTFFALSVAYAVASAGRFLKWDAPKARRVLYIDGEMPAVAMQERIANVICGVEKQPPKDFLRLVTPDLQELGIPDLAEPSGQASVDQVLAGAELVVLDNISCLFRSGVENDAESWGPVQEWALSLRRRGVSTLFIHHAGKGGLQRGTSRREDVLDTVINLKRPSDYIAADGARFEIHFEKARGLHGDDVRPLEAKLETRDNAAFWTTKDLDDCLAERVAEMVKDGMTEREISRSLGIGKGTVGRHKRKARQLGMLDD